MYTQKNLTAVNMFFIRFLIKKKKKLIPVSNSN